MSAGGIHQVMIHPLLVKTARAWPEQVMTGALIDLKALVWRLWCAADQQRHCEHARASRYSQRRMPSMRASDHDAAGVRGGGRAERAHADTAATLPGSSIHCPFTQQSPMHLQLIQCVVQFPLPNVTCLMGSPSTG